MLLFVAFALTLTVQGTFTQTTDENAMVVVSFNDDSSESTSNHATFNILEQSWDQLPDEEKENVVRVRTTATVTDLRKRIYNITCSSLGAANDTSNKNKSCTEMIIVGEFQDDGNNHVLDFVLLNGSHAIKSDDIVSRAKIRNNLASTMRLDWVDISKAEFPSPFSAKMYTFIGIILAAALTVFLILSVDVFRRRWRNRATESPTSEGDPQIVEIGFVDLPIHSPPRTFELRSDRPQPRFNERM